MTNRSVCGRGRAVIAAVAGVLAGAWLAAMPAAAQSWAPGVADPALVDEARMTFHLTWFEAAEGKLAAAAAADPEASLIPAYQAANHAMLYQDPSADIARARDLAADGDDGEQLLAAILTAFAENDLDTCRAKITDFLVLYPDDAYVRHIDGFTLNDTGDSAAGAVVLARLIADRPDFIPAYNHLGYALLDQGRLDEARVAMETFVAGAPDNPSAYDSLSEVALAEGDIEAGIAALARSVLADPDFAYGWRHLGDVLRDGGEPGLARGAYERALAAADGLYGEDFLAGTQERIDALAE